MVCVDCRMHVHNMQGTVCVDGGMHVHNMQGIVCVCSQHHCVNDSMHVHNMHGIVCVRSQQLWFKEVDALCVSSSIAMYCLSVVDKQILALAVIV